MHKQVISFAQAIKFLENMDLKGGLTPNPPCVRPCCLLNSPKETYNKTYTPKSCSFHS